MDVMMKFNVRVSVQRSPPNNAEKAMITFTPLDALNQENTDMVFAVPLGESDASIAGLMRGFAILITSVSLEDAKRCADEIAAALKGKK